MSGRLIVSRVAGAKNLTSPCTMRILLPRAEVAQLVEQRTENPRVASSILALGTILFGWSSSAGRARHS